MYGNRRKHAIKQQKEAKQGTNKNRCQKTTTRRIQAVKETSDDCHRRTRMRFSFCCCWRSHKITKCKRLSRPCQNLWSTGCFFVHVVALCLFRYCRLRVAVTGFGKRGIMSGAPRHVEQRWLVNMYIARNVGLQRERDRVESGSRRRCACAEQ